MRKIKRRFESGLLRFRGTLSGLSPMSTGTDSEASGSGILGRMPNLCTVQRLGLVPYAEAWRLQEHLAGQIAKGMSPPTLLLLQHPHVYTFGRGGKAANLLWDEAELERRGIEVQWVDRGGDVTYHGPGQLVGYPLLPLAPGGLYAGTKTAEASSYQNNPPKIDTTGYLRKLEQALILALTSFGVQGERLDDKTGVWLRPAGGEAGTEPAKIAAIGVKVDAQGITRHGFALNVNPDMGYWEGIIACGLTGFSSASLADILQLAPEMCKVEQAVIRSFGTVFDYEMLEDEPLEI